MYNVMLVYNDYKIVSKLKSLNIWGEISEFKITYEVDNVNKAYNELKKTKFDLVLADTTLEDNDTLRLLRKTKSEKLCDHFVFCSEIADFEYARQGIILGAFDYFIEPFDEKLFFKMFNRIKNEKYREDAEGVLFTEKLFDLFISRDLGFSDYLDKSIKKIICSSSKITDYTRELLPNLYNKIMSEISEKDEWFELYYINNENNHSKPKTNLGMEYYQQKITELFNEYISLYPPVKNEILNDVITYILFNPESELKQKEIADKFYLSTSFLSTLFSTQVGYKFVEFVTYIKLKRTCWLLKNTDLKVSEIADRLGYKDVGYFSRLFKHQFGTTPSDYRLPEDYCEYYI